MAMSKSDILELISGLIGTIYLYVIISVTNQDIKDHKFFRKYGYLPTKKNKR